MWIIENDLTSINANENCYLGGRIKSHFLSPLDVKVHSFLSTLFAVHFSFQLPQQVTSKIIYSTKMYICPYRVMRVIKTDEIKSKALSRKSSL